MADRKNKLGLSVAIGAGVGVALGVALHHLPLAEPRLRRWHRDRNYFDANDAILIHARYFGSLRMLLVLLLVVWRTGCDEQCG
jgi:hypothetical protein